MHLSSTNYENSNARGRVRARHGVLLEQMLVARAAL
jgi:hypothetical protein